MTSALLSKRGLLFALLVSACGGRGSDVIDPGDTSGASNCIGCGDGDGPKSSGGSAGDGDGSGGDGPDFGEIGYGDFTLRGDFDGPCTQTDSIDINLGHTPESAVRAIHCQISGTEPPAALLSKWASDLRDLEHVRRIDVAWTFCLLAERACDLGFSDPWQSQVLLEDTCERNAAGDIGAVFMFFSDCPSGVNCGSLWANTHAVGMERQHALFAYNTVAAGFHNPKNPGWWRREFLDARWAGLSFLLLNAYGPDLVSGDQLIEKAVAALDDIGGGIGLALMDDSWGWRSGQAAPYDQVPDLSQTEAAAAHIFTHKWKAFYDRVPDAHRYKFQGKPLIYFYNAGTLHPRESAPAVITRLKQLFAAEYGIEPFVVVDSAFFQDEAGMNAAADGRFTWDSFRFGGNETNTLHDVTVTHRMPRWDAVGRDRGADVATTSDNIHKGPEILADLLVDSTASDLTIIATWNDLGEGTGVNRNYDYFHEGEWLAPHHFMSMIRKSRCLSD